MTFELRSMLLEDVQQVHILDKICFSMPWPKNSFAYEVEHNRVSRPYVVEWTTPQGDKRIAASMVCWKIMDEVQIATIAVHPDFQRRGLARWLLAHGLLEAAKEGADHAFLEVRAGNKSAQELYYAFGFEAVSERKGYYRDNGEDAIVMMLDGFDLAQLQAWKENAEIRTVEEEKDDNSQNSG